MAYGGLSYNTAFVQGRFTLVKDNLHEFWSFTDCDEKRRGGGGGPFEISLMINLNLCLAILLMAKNIIAPRYPSDHTLSAN